MDNFLSTMKITFLLFCFALLMTLQHVHVWIDAERNTAKREEAVNALHDLQLDQWNLDASLGRRSTGSSEKLRSIARKINSPRSQLSDNLSLRSSQVGLLGGTMILASLIPTPLSPFLCLYGTYTSLLAGTGHVTNTLIVRENIQEYLEEVEPSLEEVMLFYKILFQEELARAGMKMLGENVESLRQASLSVSNEDIQEILNRIGRLAELKNTIEKSQTLSFTDLLDLTQTIYEFLDFIHDYTELSTDNPETAVTAFNTLKYVATQSEWNKMTNALLQYGNMQTTAMQTMGPLQTAISGVSSIWSIYSETQNIQYITRLKEDKQELVYLLRYTANDVERRCRESRFCG